MFFCIVSVAFSNQVLSMQSGDIVVSSENADLDLGTNLLARITASLLLTDDNFSTTHVIRYDSKIDSFLDIGEIFEQNFSQDDLQNISRGNCVFAENCMLTRNHLYGDRYVSTSVIIVGTRDRDLVPVMLERFINSIVSNMRG